MSNIPEYGTPDEENPEMTERDFAYARRRDGSLACPELFVKYALADVRDSLRKNPGVERQRAEKTLRHVEAALAEMDEG